MRASPPLLRSPAAACFLHPARPRYPPPATASRDPRPPADPPVRLGVGSAVWGRARLTQRNLALALTRRTQGGQGEQENAGGCENHGSEGELDLGLLSAAHPAGGAYLSRQRGRPQGRPTTALPSVQPQGKQPVLAFAFKAPPGMDLVGKLSHRGPSAGVSGVESPVGPPSSPLSHLFY